MRHTHFKLNRAFKVIQGRLYWCQQKSRTVRGRNVQLMPTLLLKHTQIGQRENSKVVDFSDSTQVWWCPGTKHLQISRNDLYCQKLQSLTYIFVAASIGLSWFKFVQWTPKDASFLQHSAFWPFRVIQGRWLLVLHCDYGPILHRFWDTATYWLKIVYFCYPSLIWRPHSLWNFVV